MDSDLLDSFGIENTEEDLSKLAEVFEMDKICLRSIIANIVLLDQQERYLNCFLDREKNMKTEQTGVFLENILKKIKEIEELFKKTKFKSVLNEGEVEEWNDACKMLSKKKKEYEEKNIVLNEEIKERFGTKDCFLFEEEIKKLSLLIKKEEEESFLLNRRLECYKKLPPDLILAKHELKKIERNFEILLEEKERDENRSFGCN